LGYPEDIINIYNIGENKMLILTNLETKSQFKFSSATVAAEDFNLNLEDLYAVLDSKKESVNGYSAEYTDARDEIILTNLETYSDFHFSSANQAAVDFNLDLETLTAVLKNTRDSVQGYSARYAN
jgi:hypothetical protein